MDAISLHHYFGNGPETGGDSSKFLAANLLMDQQIGEIIAVCDMVRGRKKRKKQLWLSFDEWNVWYRKNTEADMNGLRKEAPHLVEEVYNLEDALVVGGLIISLLRHCDRIRLACLAQLVNDIAPLVTNADGVLRQTIYYPYAWVLKYGGTCSAWPWNRRATRCRRSGECHISTSPEFSSLRVVRPRCDVKSRSGQGPRVGDRMAGECTRAGRRVPGDDGTGLKGH